MAPESVNLLLNQSCITFKYNINVKKNCSLSTACNDEMTLKTAKIMMNGNIT